VPTSQLILHFGSLAVDLVCSDLLGTSPCEIEGAIFCLVVGVADEDYEKLAGVIWLGSANEQDVALILATFSRDSGSLEAIL
jgi:hypothetical protein